MKTTATPKTITVSTSLGDAEAVRDSPREPWDISYPWGASRFYGSPKQVEKLMKETVVQYEAA